MTDEKRTIPEPTSTDGPCCAHLTVKCATEPYGDGSVTGYWFCVDCQMRFVQRIWLDDAERKLAALQAEHAALKERVEKAPRAWVAKNNATIVAAWKQPRSMDRLVALVPIQEEPRG